MRYLFYILIILATGLTSCEFLISDYSMTMSNQIPEDPDQKVITFATWLSGEGLDITLSLPKNLLTKKSEVIGNARITLFRSNGIECLDTVLYFDDTNRFIKLERFNSVPEPGDTLILHVNASGFSEVTGKTINPTTVPVDKIHSTKITSSEDFYRFTVSFDDPVQQSNYYLVSSVYYLMSYRVPALSKYDTINEEMRKAVPQNDPVFNFMPDYKTSIKEPFNNSFWKPRIFTDEAFNGSVYGLRIEIPVRNDSYVKDAGRKFLSSYEVELYTVSKDLFEFVKTSYSNIIVENDIYAQPVFIYSNMSNKAGFFGAVGAPSKARAPVGDDDVLEFDINNY